MACIGDVTLFKGSWADVALEEVPVPLEDYVLQNEALLDELQEAVEVPFEATRTSFTLGGSATKKAPRRRGGTFVAMEPEKNKRASGLSRAEKRWRNKVNKERAKAAKHRRAAP